MTSKLENWYFEKIERERKIKLPACIFNQEALKSLDRRIANRNLFTLSSFYANFGKNIDLTPFKFISESLNEPRNLLSDKDREFIKNLINIKPKDPELFFDFVGNLFYMDDLVKEINKNNDLTKIIKVSLFLWIYINFVEITNHYISELMFYYIKDKKLEKQYSDFIKLFDDGEYPSLGKTLNLAKKLNFINSDDDVIFIKNKILRNKASHANIYYDSIRDKIYLTNGEECSTEQINEAYSCLSEFLNEFLYQFNDSKTDLTVPIKDLSKKMSSMFRRFGRSSNISRHFRDIVFEWEK